MSHYPKQKIEEQYQKLPDALKDAILSVETANKIFEIGRKAKLTMEKVGFLAEESGYVILGLARPEEFVEILAERLETSTNDAREMAKEINSQIFYPLREALKAAHQMEITEPESGIPAPEQISYGAGMNQESRTTGFPAAPAAPITPQPPKVETAPPPKPMPQPSFMRPPEQERKIIPPIDLRPKPVPSPGLKFLDKFAATKSVPPPLPKSIPPLPPKPIPVPVKPPAAPELAAKEIKPPLIQKPPPPEPIRAKIPKPERMREAIFAPPVEPSPPVVAEIKKELPPAKPPEPQPEKKAPYKGYDPYKEPIE